MQDSTPTDIETQVGKQSCWSLVPRSWSQGASQVVGPLLVIMVFLALTITSWRTWPDVLIDFGREVYVPWQLSEGAVLYRDVAYFNGPLSPTINAGLFRLFGDSITTLIVANLFLLAVLTTVLYDWLRRHADHLAATLATTLFLCLFGFGHLVTVGNYNYVCPYAHELTHGITLSVFLLVLLPWRLEHLRGPRLVAAGFCLGLIFLGKAEIFVAAAGCTGVALLGSFVSGQYDCRRWLRGWSLFILGAILPPTGFLISLGTEMPLREAALGVSGSWRWIFSSAVPDLPFYQAIAGTDRPAENLLSTLESVLGMTLILGAALSYDRAQCSDGYKRRWGLFALAAAGSAIWLRGTCFPVLLDARMLTAVSILMSSSFLWLAWRNRHDASLSSRFAPWAAWAVLATLLLAKMALAPRIHHYGFVLAMPATLLMTACLVKFLPALVRGGPTFRRIVVALLLIDGLGFVLMSSSNIQKKFYSVGFGPDRMVTYDPSVSPTGPAISTLLCELESRLPEGATFVVLPEGIMLNYLTRRANPSGYTNMMPPEVLMYGEESIVNKLESSFPGYVVLIHKDTTEYGVGPFGSEKYGRQVLQWVRENYQPVKTLLAEPFSGSEFGIQLLRRTAKADW